MRTVRFLVADRGSVGADELIGFIADGGLSKDAMTAMVALREYSAFVVSTDHITGDTVLDSLIGFYASLDRALQSAGIAA